MILGQVFERFVEESPVSVMVRGLLETIFCPHKLDELFEKNTTTIFNCEIKTLGYPKAALFAFCVALVSYNILSVVLAALRGLHGIRKIEQEVSSYYLADEIKGTYRGMTSAIPPKEGEVFGQMNLIELTNILRDLATHVNLAVFMSHPRGPIPLIW